LIGNARSLYARDSFGAELEQTAYAFDSTPIDLCLTLFPWARFRKTKEAVKMHTLLDLRGSIPLWFTIRLCKRCQGLLSGFPILEFPHFP